MPELFEDFENCKSEEAVGKKWSGFRFEQRQWYRSIEDAIQRPNGYCSRNPPNVVAAKLCELLEREPTDILKRWGLFSQAITHIKDAMGEEPDHAEALANSETHTSFIVVQALCRAHPLQPFKSATKHQPPFQIAAQIGATRMVKEMIERLSEELEKTGSQDLTTALRANLNVKFGTNSKQSALSMATENGRFGVMEVLLQRDPLLADKSIVLEIIRSNSFTSQFVLHSDSMSGDLAQPNRTDSEMARQADERERVEKARGAFALILKYQSDLAGFETFKAAINPGSLVILDYLLRRYPKEYPAESAQKQSYLTSYEAARYLIENGSEDMWQIYSDQGYCKEICKRSNCFLLHEAVKQRKVGIVKWIIEHYPNQASITDNNISDGDGKYALDYLTKSDEDPGYDEIRNVIVPAIIRSETTFTIRKILNQSNVEAKEISLPLSTFNARQHNFAKYVSRLTSSLENSQEGLPMKFLDFEKVLKMADFPDLNCYLPSQPDEFRIEHHEIEHLLKWLKEHKKVEEIVNVRVLDRLHCAHDDEVVKSCVQSFNVRCLNWRKLDLYIADLDPRTSRRTPTLETLFLYSSGNRAVHDHWTNELPKFEKLENVNIYVVQDVLSDSRAASVETELKQRFSELKTQRGWKVLKVEKQRWNMPERDQKPRELEEIKQAAVGPEMAGFIKKFRDYHSSMTQPPRRIRVAVIDSGVVVVGNRDKPSRSSRAIYGSDIADRIVLGKSFVYDKEGEEQPWWHASEPHGTQMTNLICAINPCCEIYVAKVGESSKSGISATTVADSIKWATARKVDIISLSLVLYEDKKKELKHAIEAADRDDIVIFCSTADEGNNLRQTFPAEYDQSLAVAACDHNGKTLDWSQESGYQYRLLGKDVLVGPVPFLTSEEYIHGSSVATAIASGLASLILSCHRIAKYNVVDDVSWRKEAVTSRFGLMKSGVDDPPYILPSKLCGKPMPPNFVFEQLVKEAFGSSSTFARWP